jgi:Flp pilus assembly protein TadB
MKTMIILAVAGTGFAMLSCNKSYKCYCHEKTWRNRDTVMVSYQKERSEKNAKRSCENRSDSFQTCSLTQ